MRNGVCFKILVSNFRMLYNTVKLPLCFNYEEKYVKKKIENLLYSFLGVDGGVDGVIMSAFTIGLCKCNWSSCMDILTTRNQGGNNVVTAWPICGNNVATIG